MSVSMVFRKTRNTFCFEICKRLEDSNYESATAQCLKMSRYVNPGMDLLLLCCAYASSTLNGKRAGRGQYHNTGI